MTLKVSADVRGRGCRRRFAAKDRLHAPNNPLRWDKDRRTGIYTLNLRANLPREVF